MKWLIVIILGLNYLQCFIPFDDYCALRSNHAFCHNDCTTLPILRDSRDYFVVNKGHIKSMEIGLNSMRSQAVLGELRFAFNYCNRTKSHYCWIEKAYHLNKLVSFSHFSNVNNN